MALLELVANVDHIIFDVERALEEQRGAQPLPFPGMDSKYSNNFDRIIIVYANFLVETGAAICVYFLNRSCDKGTQCPFRHVAGEKSVVCKHWLRGLCKKGDQCEFLHEYDLSKMPECYFFSKYSKSYSALLYNVLLSIAVNIFTDACSNKECPFRHIDPESKIKDCAWYDRGFCRNGTKF